MTDRLEELLAKQDIHEVTMRYCRGVDRFDAELLGSAYHLDAVDDHGGRMFSGPTIGQDIVQWMRETLKVCTHQITTQNIHLDGERAGCESYYTGLHVELGDDDHTMLTVGRYLDRLERRDGEWRIAQRLVVLEVARYLPAADRVVSVGAGLARHDRSDPSYAVLES